MPNVKKTISLPKPLHDFAVRQSKVLTEREKGEAKENLSMYITEVLREAKERLEPVKS